MALLTECGLVVSWLVAICFIDTVFCKPSFVIDFSNDTFVRDGKPFRYISGSVHYFRVPRAYWRDRLTKSAAAGLDAIQFYIPWNYHESVPGLYDFSGERDVVEFLRIIQSLGLLAILRPGPYICGEWDFGGFPSWILRDNPNIALRSSDPTYLHYVARWFGVLLPLLEPLLYENGGPIIMAQMENEYGSFPACDRNYKQFLYDLMRKHLGDRVVLFTTDGAGEGYVRCGSFPNLTYTTVDFGPGTDVDAAFAVQRKFAPHGPLVNSEYYPGWLDIWGSSHATTNTNDVLATLTQMLKRGANVNFYMFHGGTSFTYNSGADPQYIVQPTSYDYDAPLTEAGDTTQKYMAIRSLLSQLKPVPAHVPPNTTKTAYGAVSLASRRVSLPELLRAGGGRLLAESARPQRMEALGVWRGFLLYQWSDPSRTRSGAVSAIVHDRAYVYDQNWKWIGVLDREKKLTSVSVSGVQALNVLVENMGHLNFGAQIVGDSKGIVSNVTLDSEELTGWRHVHFEVEEACDRLFQAADLSRELSRDLFQRADLKFVKSLSSASNVGRHPESHNKAFFDEVVVSETSLPSFVPTFYAGLWNVSDAGADTFVSPAGWGKGVLVVRAADGTTRTLGRYWPLRGPQLTLYLPAPFLSAGRNGLCAFELEQSPCTQSASACSLQLVDTPKIDLPPRDDPYTNP